MSFHQSRPSDDAKPQPGAVVWQRNGSTNFFREYIEVPQDLLSQQPMTYIGQTAYMEAVLRDLSMELFAICELDNRTRGGHSRDWSWSEARERNPSWSIKITATRGYESAVIEPPGAMGLSRNGLNGLASRAAEHLSSMNDFRLCFQWRWLNAAQNPGALDTATGEMPSTKPEYGNLSVKQDFLLPVRERYHDISSMTYSGSTARGTARSSSASMQLGPNDGTTVPSPTDFSS